MCARVFSVFCFSFLRFGLSRDGGVFGDGIELNVRLEKNGSQICSLDLNNIFVNFSGPTPSPIFAIGIISNYLHMYSSHFDDGGVVCCSFQCIAQEFYVCEICSFVHLFVADS